MKPNIVFPLNDPQGSLFSHIEAVLPVLRRLFAKALVGFPPETGRKQPAEIRRLSQDCFFHLTPMDQTLVGDQFTHLYCQAAAASNPEQILHLCFADRLVYILQSEHKEFFIEDTSNQANRFCKAVSSGLPWSTG